MSDDVPTMGWGVLAWLMRHLSSPRDETQPYRPADWQALRTLRWYELDASGKRLWNRVHDEDPKGKGKSPHAGATAIVEFRGPVVFDGWARAGDVYACERHGCRCGWEYRYQPGEPRGRPWGSPGLPAPWVQVAAVSEAQTANTWAALHAFLAANDGRLADWLRLDAGRTLVYWTDRVDAKIERVSSSAASRTGQPITHSVMDEPQEWTPALRGPVLADTIMQNLTKLDGWAHFTGNAPVLGLGSVAEQLSAAAPRALHLAPRPSIEPREDMARDELRPLLEEVYEGTPWAPIERILDDIEDRAAHPWPSSYRLFLNMPLDMRANAVWMDPEAWAERAGRVALSPREPAFAVVRIAHGHQEAAVAVAQVQGPDGRRVAVGKEGQVVMRSGDRVVLACRTFRAETDGQVSLAAIEQHLQELRRACPARVVAAVRYSGGGREHVVPVAGPEIAYAGAFFAGPAQRLRSERAALVDIPSTTERLVPAAESLLRVVDDGSLVHDGGEELAQQLAAVTAEPSAKGWKPASGDQPVPAAFAAMLAVHRAITAPRPVPGRIHGLGGPR